MTQENREKAARDSYEALKRARDRLHEALDQDPRGDEPAWLQRVQAGVSSLSDALKEHQRLSEDEAGLLRELTGEKPSLLMEGGRLEREHEEMLLRASEIEREVERQLAAEEFRVELIRLESAVLHDLFHLHIVRADWFIYEAFNREEGGEGG